MSTHLLDINFSFFCYLKEEEPVLENIDVSKLDIRVGKIVSCDKHPEADSLYVEQIDLGEGKLRSVCSGLVKYIPLDQVHIFCEA